MVRWFFINGFPKSIVHFPGWSDPSPETGYCWFDAPLAIAGYQVEGLVLHGGYLQHVPDANVTFELRVANPRGNRTIPLARIDWRCAQGGHTNPRRQGSPVSGKRLSPSHHHSFALNWNYREERMEGRNLPMAEDLPEGVSSFESLREFTGKMFRITNMDVVGLPEWEYELFPND